MKQMGLESLVKVDSESKEVSFEVEFVKIVSEVLEYRDGGGISVEHKELRDLALGKEIVI
ncbi:MAG: hypothetical protein NC818_05390 [Candidatus Omnitrophica bacterium]|nr:hypothetical protein [Candidatus Omnitrophota bacterium]